MFKPEKYPAFLRTLHWLMAFMILGMIAAGYYMSDLPDSHPLKWKIYAIHKSCGLTILALFVLRILTRLTVSVPALPYNISRADRFAAGLAHKTMYLFMFAVPFSGLMASMYAGYGAAWFGWSVPHFVQKSEKLAMFYGVVHLYAPYFFLGLITLHFLGVAKHYFIDRTNLLKRML